MLGKLLQYSHIPKETYVLLSAVDNQIFVAMCSPARDLSAGYHAVSSNEA